MWRGQDYESRHGQKDGPIVDHKAAGFSRSSFDRAVAINPLDWRPHHQLALQTYRATDFARSAVHWQEAVVRRPTMAELHEGLGDTLCLIVSRL